MGIESKNTNGVNYIKNEDLSKFKTRTNSKDTLAQFEDPTYLGFKLFFRGINDSNHGGLLGAASNSNSARYYLNQIGDTTRFKMLDTFVNLLQKINKEYPWYFQSITGLDECWKRRAEIEKPEIKGQITIACIESLDLRMSALVDLYRKATYDWVHKREVLTDNLRHFEMGVMVYDNRTFMQSLAGDKIDGVEPKPNSNSEEVNKTFFGESEFEYSQFMFDFSFVEINMGSGGDLFSSINNGGNEAAQQSLIFDYELVEESNLFKILSMLYKSDDKKFWYVKDYVNNIITNLSGGGLGEFNKSLLGGGGIQTSSNVDGASDAFNLKDEIAKAKAKAADELKNATEGFIEDLKKDALASVTNAVTAGLSSLFLGNVYGFSAGSIVSAGAAGVRSKIDELGNNLLDGETPTFIQNIND